MAGAITPGGLTEATIEETAENENYGIAGKGESGSVRTPPFMGNRAGKGKALRNPEEISRAVETHADMVRRICLVHLKNEHDTEDVFQNVFMKYMSYKGSFENDEHEKAWFVRVTINACTDWLRSLSRRRWVPLESVLEESNMPDETSREVLEAVLQLPEKYRRVIYLFYYEGYSAVEIAGILGKKENTIYTWLSRAKGKLREILEEESLNTDQFNIAGTAGDIREEESREVSGHEQDS